MLAGGGVRCPTDGARGSGGGGEALRPLRRIALDRDRLRGAPHLRLLLACLAQPQQGRVRRAGRALVGGLHHHLDPFPAGRAAPLADDRRTPGERAADRPAAAGRGEDPARRRRRLRALCPRPAGASRGPAPVGQRDPVLDPGRRRARLRRELLRAGLSGRQPALRPLRAPPARRVHGPRLVCARGRRRHRQRADRGCPRDRRRAPVQPHGHSARLRGSRPRPPAAASGTDPSGPARNRVNPSSPWPRVAASPLPCS